MSSRIAVSRVTTHPLWQGKGGWWRGIFQIVWVALRFWLAQQLWGTAVRLAHFPAPTKNLGLLVTIISLLLFIWGVRGLWQVLNTLGVRRLLLTVAAIYLLFLFINILTIPDQRPLTSRLVGQAGQTAAAMARSPVSAIQSLLAAPDDFLFAYSGERRMPELPPGFPTPDPQATPVRMDSTAGEDSGRSLRPTPGGK